MFVGVCVCLHLSLCKPHGLSLYQHQLAHSGDTSRYALRRCDGVQVSEDGAKVRYVDRAGNNHFNTLGNLVLDPRVGVTFVEFETGSLLQVRHED
jgi:hypothetical protein